MTTKISQWQRIALLAAGISTSMVSMAWGQDLYQTHTDGSIWQYTGTPCSRVSCPGWIELDNNPDLKMIAAGGGALYEMHLDGSIWWYTGTPCSGGYCPGWVEIDNNPLALAIGVGGNVPYEVLQDYSLWEFNGTICTAGYCPGWVQLGGYSSGITLPYGANATQLVQQEGGVIGQLLMYTGTPCTSTSCPGWEQILSIPPSSFAVGANAVYVLAGAAGILQYVPSPTNPGWLILDVHPTTAGISAGGSLYQWRNNNTIWQYTGTPCNESETQCPGWVKIDNHPHAGVPVAGSNTVYEMRTPSPGEVSIWQYTGTPCNGSVCSGWVPLDDNPNTTSIVAGPVAF